MSTSRRGFLKGMGKGLLATALATASQSKAISKLIDEHPKTVENLLESPGGFEPRKSIDIPEAEPVITEEITKQFNENVHKHFDISSHFPDYEPAKKPEIELQGTFPEEPNREYLDEFLNGPELSNKPHKGIIPVAGIGDKRYAYSPATGQVYKGQTYKKEFSWERMWGIDRQTFFKETGLIINYGIIGRFVKVKKYTGPISDTE